MYKKLMIFFILTIFVFFLADNKSLSYEAFNGKYNYNQFDNSSASNYVNNDADDNTEVLFVVDFSASMSKKIGYAPKVYHAIDAIRSILRESGDRTKIGLRIFGVTDKPMVEMDRDGYHFHKENICTASSLVMPIARYNSSNISDKLSQLSPQGGTPIGYSLRQAVQNDFSPSATLKHIILITDGAENCGDDPCLYIKRLMQLRSDIRIDVIGITVDSNAYSQLRCIAGASKGKYYAVDSAEDFKLKFKEAFDSRPQVKTEVKTQLLPPKETVLQKQPLGIKYKNFTFMFDN